MNRVAVGIIVILLIGLSVSVYHDETETYEIEALTRALAEAEASFAPELVRLSRDHGLILETERLIRAILNAPDSTVRAEKLSIYGAFKDSVAAEFNALAAQKLAALDSIRGDTAQ